MEQQRNFFTNKDLSTEWESNFDSWMNIYIYIFVGVKIRLLTSSDSFSSFLCKLVMICQIPFCILKTAARCHTEMLVFISQMTRLFPHPCCRLKKICPASFRETCQWLIFPLNGLRAQISVSPVVGLLPLASGPACLGMA